VLLESNANRKKNSKSISTNKYVKSVY